MKRRRNKRNVLGLSAWIKSVDLLDLVRLAETQRHGKSEAQLACEALHIQPELADWSEDTCRRYLQVAARLDDSCKEILTKWEYAFGRACLVDGINNLRAAAKRHRTRKRCTLCWRTCGGSRTARFGQGWAVEAVVAFPSTPLTCSRG